MKLLDPVTTVPLIGPNYGHKLAVLGVRTIGDLLYHIPFRYVDFRHTSQIRNLKADESATIRGQVVSFANVHTKKGKLMQVANVSDGDKKINVLWFNQPYIANAIPVGSQVSISGKVSFWQRKLVIFSPQYEKLQADGNQVHTGRLIPIYSETAGISSKWIRSRVNFVLKHLTQEELKDYLDSEKIKEHKLPSLSESLQNIHLPLSPEDAQKARERLAFDELLQIQVENTLKRIKWQKYTQTLPIKMESGSIEKFVESLPFTLTPSQSRSIDEIAKDLVVSHPMNRLLEGDVGSGKTVVAALGVYLAHKNGYRSAVMAPTQILANQHFDTFKSLLKPFGIKVSLITGTTKLDQKDTHLVVGTHALIAKSMSLQKSAFIVIDEQHRFGVKQRGDLATKATTNNMAPNILTMTATPIPRTIALTLYGDLDLSTLDELPKDRQKVTTWITPESKRKKAYEWIYKELKKEGGQAFVVCPLIEESDSPVLKEVKSVKLEIKRVQKLLPEAKVGLLHGQMKAKEKDKILGDFKNGKYDILVTTPVVEVGIDIPNATIMVIETADRFGLAQLHQLRGRVGRGSKKSYCLLLTEGKGEKVQTRLNAMTHTHSGRELAELDLKIRGVGQIFGTRQSGASELKIATWQDIDLFKSTKKLAAEIVENQKKYKSVIEYYKSKQPSNN